MINLETQKLEDAICSLIGESNLPVCNIYLIVSKLYYELETLYKSQVEKELLETIPTTDRVTEEMSPIHINLNEIKERENNNE